MKQLFSVLVFLAVLFPTDARAFWEVGQPLKNTYSASSDVITTPYATPTDLCVIGGTSGVMVKVFHARVWGKQTTGGMQAFYLIKRSVKDTLASNQSIPVVPHDSAYPAAGADVTMLAAAPTNLGTQIGVVKGADVLISAPSTTSANSIYDFDFGPATGVQPIYLRANEQLAINFGGVAVPTGMGIFCEFTWTEE